MRRINLTTPSSRRDRIGVHSPHGLPASLPAREILPLLIQGERGHALLSFLVAGAGATVHGSVASNRTLSVRGQSEITPYL